MLVGAPGNLGAMISSFMLSHLVLPTLVSVFGHVSFCFLLLSKWQSMELMFADGEPILFANFSQYIGEPVGPTWWAVFTPSWTAESIVIVVTILAICSPGLHTSVNARLMHYTSLMQTCAHAAFKVLLVRRCLDSPEERGSWFVTFSPIYVGISLQLVMHYHKQPDSRGKRPGLPLSVLGLLSIVVSFKLQGVLSTSEWSWLNILWPLWLTICCVGASLLLGLCCGVPLILRSREVHSQMAFFVLALLLVLLAIYLPAVLAAVRLTLWLDGAPAISAAMILVSCLYPRLHPRPIPPPPPLSRPPLNRTGALHRGFYSDPGLPRPLVSLRGVGLQGARRRHWRDRRGRPRCAGTPPRPRRLPGLHLLPHLPHLPDHRLLLLLLLLHRLRHAASSRQAMLANFKAPMVLVRSHSPPPPSSALLRCFPLIR